MGRNRSAYPCGSNLHIRCLPPSALNRLPARMAQDTGPAGGERPPEPVWRKWYHTSRWTKLREKVLLRDLFTCRMCGRIQGDTSQLVADHIAPHRGNAARFWDEANLQTLCANPCHNTHKAALERQQGAGCWD